MLAIHLFKGIITLTLFTFFNPDFNEIPEGFYVFNVKM